MEEDIEEMADWDDEQLGLDDDDLSEKLTRYAVAMGDDPRDEDWLPPELARRMKKKKGPKKCEFNLQ